MSEERGGRVSGQESGRGDDPHNYLGDCRRRPGAEAKQAGERSAASLRGAALLQRGHHDDIVMTFTQNIWAVFVLILRIYISDVRLMFWQTIYRCVSFAQNQ